MSKYNDTVPFTKQVLAGPYILEQHPSKEKYVFVLREKVMPNGMILNQKMLRLHLREMISSGCPLLFADALEEMAADLRRVYREQYPENNGTEQETKETIHEN